MSNPPKKKGTGGETELRRNLEAALPGLTRTPPTSTVDLWRPGRDGGRVFNLLGTRPDRGQWLITMSLDTFRELADGGVEIEDDVYIEVKRYSRFALHRIWEKKFGGTP